MEENFKSKFGFCLFFLLIFGLLIGGYFFTKYYLQEDEVSKLTEKTNYKIDDSKDYFYFINEGTISESAEIYYKDVVININTQTTLTEALAKENQIYKNNIKYIKDQDNIIDDIITYKNDDIYSLMFRMYETYEFGKYISLVVKDYDYSCFTGITFNKSTAYVFNKDEGKRLLENDLLNMYGLNIDKVKERVKEYLESIQTEIDDEPVIKIDETLNNLKLNSLYINEYGKLVVSYIVKTTQTDYNEITEVN